MVQIPTNFLSSALSAIGNWFSGIFGSFGSSGSSGVFGSQSPLTGVYGLLSNPSGAWDRFRNGETNIINKQVADQNLAFQQETQEYNRALQERLFEREDTAYQRTAMDMAKAGLNPLTMISTDSSGQALQEVAKNNSYQHHDIGTLGALSTIASIAQGINQVQTGMATRDSIQLENEKKRLENMKEAYELGFDVPDILGIAKNDAYVQSGQGSYWKNKHYSIGNLQKDYDIKGVDWLSKSRELDYKTNNNLFDYDTDIMKTIKLFGSTDLSDLFERFSTRLSELGNSFLNDKDSNSAGKRLFQFLLGF